MSVRAILQLMSDGEFHSGEALGELLGVSRTAVWKHLQKLEAYGIPLESVKGRGYCVPGGLQLLDAAQIQGALAPAANSCLRELDIHESVDSTNALAMARASTGAAGGYVCLAEHQSRGRGRRGRPWVSPFAQSVYLSVVAEFSGGAAALEGLSLAVGVALVRALNTLGAEQVLLKWPNDLVCGDRKLAGILLEMAGDPAGQCQVVVGVGLNMALSSAGAEAIDQPWVDLQQLVPGVSRNALVAELLNQLLPLLAEFESKGFGAYREEWERSHAYADKPVRLVIGNTEVAGIALGVAANGALRLLVGGEEQEFHGGEISLRPAGG
ncbi:bifunctional biotin--[acetyl-CoA-carboxylase] ligase/biotin operon repressor BirA [Pseudomaricurvus sp. HS19]|uniref:bifunctional biotin--[acetyl-CoA-carboxylase] ligase/biotin operon repressor BirA n=1 Tax=Pseudomaricurvus sp. HS19 TaxID=2692626 RepID=UPI001371FC59|nr:bifunctional biotin--[acetyl-CoA-carboxylase] ligase/biotin operon repressor BirA [Pseudomaricurvus sp. HS19]MYM65204.1 bifunctional biotin--[acetyl-CoA-carboxylase] ligase/biotin operon repressor BirA [Pseudomaricurvus sp. HS19]